MEEPRYVQGVPVTSTKINGDKPEFGNPDHIHTVQVMDKEDNLEKFILKNNHGKLSSWPDQIQSVEVECRGCSSRAEGDSYDQAVSQLETIKEKEGYKVRCCRHCDFIFSAHAE